MKSLARPDTDPQRPHEPDPYGDTRDESGVRRRLSIEPSAPTRRPWEHFISREEVLLLLEEGRTIDLMARLMEAHRTMPHDLEVLRSLRILTQYIHKRFDIDL